MIKINAKNLLFSSDRVAKFFLLLLLNEFHSWSSEDRTMHGRTNNKATNINFILLNLYFVFVYQIFSMF